MITFICGLSAVNSIRLCCLFVFKETNMIIQTQYIDKSEKSLIIFIKLVSNQNKQKLHLYANVFLFLFYIKMYNILHVSFKL